MKPEQLLTHQDRILRDLAKISIISEKISVQIITSRWVHLHINGIKISLHQLQEGCWIVYFDDPTKIFYLDRDMDLFMERLKEFN